jgi:hypothetical protein
MRRLPYYTGLTPPRLPVRYLHQPRPSQTVKFLAYSHLDGSFARPLLVYTLTAFMWYEILLSSQP